MADEQVATLPPASTTQPSNESKSANVSVEQYARRLSASEQTAQPAENVPAAPAVETAPPPQESVSTETVDALVPEVGAALNEPEPVAEPEADEALSHQTSFTPEQQAIFNKRLGKEVAKRKALEAELAQAKAPREVPQNLPPVVIAPSADQPLANITDINALRQVEAETRLIKNLAEDALDMEGVELTGAQIGNDTYTKEKLKLIRRNAQRQLEEAIPARERFLGQRATFDQQAMRDFPYLADRNSPEHQQAVAILRDRQNAWLHSVPDALIKVGLIIEGGKTVAARNKPVAPAKPKPVVNKTAPASQVAFGGATGTIRTPSNASGESFLKSGMKSLGAKRGVTAADMAKLLSQHEQLQSTRS